MEKQGDKSSSGPSTTSQEPAATSVAHQILGEFLASLEQQEGYAEIGKRLRPAILESKPSDTTLRRALFGDEPL